MAAATDAAGVVKRFTYDARGLLTATTENAVPGAAPSASVNVTTSTSYDARGLATSVTDPRGNATAYTRDALGRLTAETNALGRTTSTTYDKLGRPTAVTAADGSVTTTSYTPDGLVAKVVRPDQTVAYTYDAAGNRLTMKDKVGTSSWAYDWAGRTSSETDARGKTTRHAYDLAGNLAGILYPDGRSVARTFDARELAVTQTDTTAAGASSVTTFAYDENGAQTGQVRSSGLTTQIDRDLAGRVTSIDYTGLGVTGNPLPSGAVNPSSAAPGNAYGHCKANGNGHPNQQPAGCTTGTLTFAYAYDERGLVAQRDVTTGSSAADAVTTETVYAHDPLGRLTRSATGGAATIYAWDAASNLVGEGGTDDPSTAKTGDAYAVARTVNAANELVTLVKNPVGTPGGKVATTQFTYDARGNRTGAVTTTQTGNKTHVESTSTFVYDSLDQVTSTTGLEGSAAWVRDGMGRALTVTEGGVTSARLYDGFTVVADGATQLATAPNGQVLGETTTTSTTKGKTTTTSVAAVDVLTDVLGSAVSTASDGVISADLALYGDFGDLLTTPKAATSKTATVTGFTGKLETTGLVEFVARTYDPTTRQWVQDDRYRGTTTRAASMNRYAYVEGAPESFVDHLGFFRAAAALQAQKLAALWAGFYSELGALEDLYGVAIKHGQNWSVDDMLRIYDQINRNMDPAVRAALDPIVRQLAYEVTQIHAQRASGASWVTGSAPFSPAKINQLWAYQQYLRTNGSQGAQYVLADAQLDTLQAQRTAEEQARDDRGGTNRAEALAIAVAIRSGGSVSNDGPFCGVYMVCIVNAGFSANGQNTITRGRVVVTGASVLKESTQVHEFGHVIDQLFAGVTQFDRDYVSDYLLVDRADLSSYVEGRQTEGDLKHDLLLQELYVEAKTEEYRLTGDMGVFEGSYYERDDLYFPGIDPRLRMRDILGIPVPDHRLDES